MFLLQEVWPYSEELLGTRKEAKWHVTVQRTAVGQDEEW